jgi:hypothetical protein
VHTPPCQPEGRGKIERFFRHSYITSAVVVASVPATEVRESDDASCTSDSLRPVGPLVPIGPIGPFRFCRSVYARLQRIGLCRLS